jgi:hypothetical protein
VKSHAGEPDGSPKPLRFGFPSLNYLGLASRRAGPAQGRLDRACNKRQTGTPIVQSSARALSSPLIAGRIFVRKAEQLPGSTDTRVGNGIKCAPTAAKLLRLRQIGY